MTFSVLTPTGFDGCPEGESFDGARAGGGETFAGVAAFAGACAGGGAAFAGGGATLPPEPPLSREAAGGLASEVGLLLLSRGDAGDNDFGGVA